MNDHRIHTALNVPTVISFPSPRSLQWSSDGQIFFITKSAVYVLTPDHGVNFDNESVIKAPASKDARDDRQSIGWFRTMVQDTKAEGTRWPDLSQAWGIVSLGSIDASIISVASSPSGTNSDGRSVLAVLTSNMDVSLWTSGKNYLKGECHKIMDVTPFLIPHYTSGKQQPYTPSAILQAQTTCMAWTSQADYQIYPSPMANSSLLIIGNRGGCLSFLRYSAEDQAVSFVSTISVADAWISHIAASPWSLISPGICESYVAYGTSDGSVGLVKFTQTLTVAQTQFSFVPTYEIEVRIEKVPQPVFNPDKSGITALEWIPMANRPSVLVVCKPGIVCLWSFPCDGRFWSGQRTIELQTQRMSNASSAFHPASGVVYIRHRDALIISLFDGSIHAIHNLSSDPSLQLPSPEDPINSEKLSRAARAVFSKVEPGTVDKNGMNRINGLLAYDGGSSFIWAHESAVPSDFSYKHDAKHSSMIVVAEMWDDPDDAIFLQRLEVVINRANNASRISPLHALRPFFFHLHNQGRLEVIHEAILRLLETIPEDYSLNIRIPKLELPLTEDTRKKFRSSLTSHLFGWNEMASLRMKLSLADFVWKFSSTEEKRTQCGEIAQGILNSISHRTLRTLIRHVASVVGALRSNDIPFILRLIVQSLLAGSPPDLSAEGNALSALTDPLVPKNPATGSVATELDEVCPACQVVVPLQDITSAVCSNGHHWARCSITTFILSTPWVRTCVGCSRKAFLPPSTSLKLTGQVQLPLVAQGWVVSDLLEAVHQCLFCNNSFVSLL